MNSHSTVIDHFYSTADDPDGAKSLQHQTSHEGQSESFIHIIQSRFYRERKGIQK